MSYTLFSEKELLAEERSIKQTVASLVGRFHCLLSGFDQVPSIRFTEAHLKRPGSFEIDFTRFQRGHCVHLIVTLFRHALIDTVHAFFVNEVLTSLLFAQVL